MYLLQKSALAELRARRELRLATQTVHAFKYRCVCGGLWKHLLQYSVRVFVQCDDCEGCARAALQCGILHHDAVA